MERCECVVNRLLKALEQLAHSLIGNHQANSLSTTDSGETLQGLDNSHHSISPGTNNLFAMGLIAMILFCLVLRNRERKINSNDNNLVFSSSKLDKKKED